MAIVAFTTPRQIFPSFGVCRMGEEILTGAAIFDREVEPHAAARVADLRRGFKRLVSARAEFASHDFRRRIIGVGTSQVASLWSTSFGGSPRRGREPKSQCRHREPSSNVGYVSAASIREIAINLLCDPLNARREHIIGLLWVPCSRSAFWRLRSAIRYANIASRSAARPSSHRSSLLFAGRP